MDETFCINMCGNLTQENSDKCNDCIEWDLRQKHSDECVDYNEKFIAENANLGECICEDK